MTNNQIVNIDYIPIVRQVGNSVAVERLHISKPAELLATLKIMVENPNHTIYDIQNQMTRHFREPERKYLSFLSPYSYYSAWVEGVSFPQIYTYDEYKQLTKDTQEEALKSNESTLNFYRKEYGEELAQQKLSEFIQKETQRKKEYYYKQCIRYIDAYYYKKTISECKNKPDIKMYSEEYIGLRTFKYTVSSDITIFVDTNFGYGNSAFFHIRLRYKEIDILPYSFVVNYYYADIREIRKCTRNYFAAAENWNFAFDFVENAVNMAASDEVKFCEEFLKNEINAMISGLEALVKSPGEFINKFTTMKNRENPIPYLRIRHIAPKEISEYNAYPSDMPIAVMAEKISDAYELLDSLSKLTLVYPYAQTGIDRIKQITLEAIPKAEEHKAKNVRIVETHNARINAIKLELEPLKAIQATHNNQINSIYEAQKEGENAKSQYEIRIEYGKTHPEYVQVNNDICKKENEINKLSAEIMTRSAFLRRLETCIKLK